MLDQNAFRETLHLVQELAAASEKPMSREEALSYFRDMELSEEQQELVFRFLQQPASREEMAAGKEASEQKEAPNTSPESSWAGGKSVKRSEAGGESAKRSKPEKASADNGTGHFQTYMRQVQRISRLEQPKEQQLYRRLLEGDKRVIEEISHQWLHRIVTMAKEYQGRGFYLDDLVQEGNMALLTALHELAGRSHTKELEKQLVEAVMDAMEQYVGLESGTRQQEETILAKVSLLHEAREFLRDQSGAEPTVEQLMDYTRLTWQEIDDIMELMKKAGKSNTPP